MNMMAVTKDGLFDPARMASVFLTTQQEVARSVGLGRDAIQRKDRLTSPKTQTRLREMIEIINRVSPGFGSDLMAFAWYRSEILVGFGDKTAADLVAEGHADWVHHYLDAIDNGIYA
jgi:uncharacterized protein (DUF2384 family)